MLGSFCFLFLTPLPDGTLRIRRDVFPKGRYTRFFSDSSLGDRPWPFVALKDPKWLAVGAEVAFFDGEKIDGCQYLEIGVAIPGACPNTILRIAQDWSGRLPMDH